MSAPPDDDGLTELWERFRSTGDLDLRNRLVLHYAPLVKYVAGRMRSRMPDTVQSDDLVSDGVLGLIDALSRFEPARGLTFQTFAVPRIRGAMLDGLRSLDTLPRSVRATATEVQASQVALEHRLGRTPDDEELAAETGLTLRALRDLNSSLSADKHSSLDAFDLTEQLASAGSGAEADPDFTESLLRVIAQLAEREQIMIALYYFENLTMGEIGTVLGVSQARISQALSKATMTLRSKLDTAETD
jgi:RNA polymerase sigma factor for flagellar operon FliA